MANVITQNFSFTLPEVGADTNAWGGHLNGNFQTIDNQMLSRTFTTAQTMAGALNLPANGLNVGSGQLQVTGGNVSSSGNLSGVNGSFSGTLTVTGTSSHTGAATFGGTIGVTGVATLSNNATIGGTLSVTGAAGFSAAVTAAFVPTLGAHLVNKTYVDGTFLAVGALGTGVQTALGQAVTGSGGIVLASGPSITNASLTTPSLGTATATRVTYSAGTTTVAPIVLTAGTNLTTPAAGAFEYDGDTFYATPAANSRGLLDVEHYVIAAASKSFVANTSSQAIFAGVSGLTAGSITLPTGTHMIEMVLPLTGLPSGGSHGMGLFFSGTATVTSYSGSAIDCISLQAGVVTSSNTVFMTASTQASAYVLATVMVRVSVAGTITPQLYQTGSLAAFTMAAGSSIRVKRMGASATSSVGNWS